MADHLDYLMAHAEDLVPVMYDFARKVAARKFGWRQGMTLPLGKTPEDIVTDVYCKYVAGDRRFDPTKDILLQLKGSVRSLIWALGAKSSTRKELVARSEEEVNLSVQFASTEANPAEMADSADFARSILKRVQDHPKVQESPELQDLLAAYELGITEPDTQAAELKKTAAQVHQLRHQLRSVYGEAINELNKD